MRLVIDGPGYASAAEAFATANQVAAIQYDSLVGRLGSYAAMAGDDSTSSEFAAAYDEAAAEAVSALADVVPAFANLGRLTHRCVSNHREANVELDHQRPGGLRRQLAPRHRVRLGARRDAAVRAGRRPAQPLRRDELDPRPHRGVRLAERRHRPPPQCRQRLARRRRRPRPARQPAAATRPPRCGRSAPPRSRSRSPPPRSSRRPCRRSAAQFAGLATACEEYADQVDQKREEILALLEEILAMIVEGIVVSVAIGLITGGAGALAASGAVVAKVAAQSPRFAAILSALRSAASATSTTVRTARTALRSARLRVRKFLDARIPPRNEFGHLTHRRCRRLQARGWLPRARTLGKPHDREARREDCATSCRRSVDGPGAPERSSSFPDQRPAEDADRRRAEPTTRSGSDAWLRRRRRRLCSLDGHVD